MTSQKPTSLLLSALVCLVAVVSLSEAGGTRCLYTHGDPHCDVTGSLPLQLNCSYPGKWFTVQSVSKQNVNGVRWQQVPAAVGSAESLCKASQVAGAGRAGAYCTVSGSLPEISADDVIKVDYYCWEFDPDLLGGFGKRSRSQLKARIFHRTRGF
ncbi:hypothetical protein ACROYT_G042926 [Oculina patagonica]